MQRGQNSTDRGPIYDGQGVQYTMDRWLDIPWEGRSKYHGYGSDIAWIVGSIYHG